jgi:hypothetical protein
MPVLFQVLYGAEMAEGIHTAAAQIDPLREHALLWVPRIREWE